MVHNSIRRLQGLCGNRNDIDLDSPDYDDDTTIVKTKSYGQEKESKIILKDGSTLSTTSTNASTDTDTSTTSTSISDTKGTTRKDSVLERRLEANDDGVRADVSWEWTYIKIVSVEHTSPTDDFDFTFGCGGSTSTDSSSPNLKATVEADGSVDCDTTNELMTHTALMKHTFTTWNDIGVLAFQRKTTKTLDIKILNCGNDEDEVLLDRKVPLNMFSFDRWGKMTLIDGETKVTISVKRLNDMTKPIYPTKKTETPKEIGFETEIHTRTQ